MSNDNDFLEGGKLFATEEERWFTKRIVTKSDWQTLEAGSDEDWYWETWSNVLDKALINRSIVRAFCERAIAKKFPQRKAGTIKGQVTRLLNMLSEQSIKAIVNALSKGWTVVYKTHCNKIRFVQPRV